MSMYVIDGMGVLYRAHYAATKQPRLTPDGRDVSALGGLAWTLKKILRAYNPSHLCVCWEGSGQLLRQERFPAYKLGRKPRPVEIKEQLPLALELVEAMGCHNLSAPRLEADDVMASVAIACVRDGLDCSIVTNDKDLYSLVGPGVQIVIPAGADWKVVDVEAVREKFGVEPEQVPEILALMGDSADNIPGVPGIGEKGAAKLIEEYGTVEQLYARLGEMPPSKIRDRLWQHQEDAKLSRDIIELCFDEAAVPPLGELVVLEPDRAALAAMAGRFSLERELEVA